jgi:hypothetical protein
LGSRATRRSARCGPACGALGGDGGTRVLDSVCAGSVMQFRFDLEGLDADVEREGRGCSRQSRWDTYSSLP